MVAEVAAYDGERWWPLLIPAAATIRHGDAHPRAAGYRLRRRYRRTAGLAAGVPYAAQTHDAGQIPTLVGAALMYLPAIWVVAALTAALYGVTPRATTAGSAVLAACFVIGFLGDVLKLPRWVIQLSPFAHTPQLPAASLRPVPLIALLAIATALTAAGVAAFRHRDLR